MDKVTRLTVSTNHILFEEKGEPKRYRTEVLPLTSLTPYRHWGKPAHCWMGQFVRFITIWYEACRPGHSTSTIVQLQATGNQCGGTIRLGHDFGLNKFITILTLKTEKPGRTTGKDSFWQYNPNFRQIITNIDIMWTIGRTVISTTNETVCDYRWLTCQCVRWGVSGTAMRWCSTTTESWWLGEAKPSLPTAWTRLVSQSGCLPCGWMWTLFLAHQALWRSGT